MSRPSKWWFVLGLVLVAGAAWFWYQSRIVHWPTFAQSEGAQPAFVVRTEPDFGYRIGDVVPVTVYILEKPGTSVDIESIAVEGDFEIRDAINPSFQDNPDGSRFWRVDLKLQSFSAAPKHASRLSLSWRPDEERRSQESQTLIEVYSSRTWDGRKQIQEGPLPFITGYHMALSLGWVALTVFGIVALTRWIRRNTPPLPEAPPQPISRKQLAVQACQPHWQKILSGDLDKQNFREIESIVREFFKVETVLGRHIDIALNNYATNAQIQRFIELFDKAIYQAGDLTEEEVAEAYSAYETFML